MAIRMFTPSENARRDDRRSEPAASDARAADSAYRHRRSDPAAPAIRSLDARGASADVAGPASSPSEGKTPANYCTYFDHRYLPRGLALYASLRRHCEPFRLWVLCLSGECFAVLSALRLPGIIPLQLHELEAFDQELRDVKPSRSLIEYYFTCTPALPAWLFAVNPDIDVLTYLDADLFFFARPDFLLQEFENYSTLIVPHHFSEKNRIIQSRGIYNVGWVSFRRSREGLACLHWWRRSCLDWCFVREEPGRYADQKYLERFPEKFAAVQIARHPGVNVAPWNLDRYRLSVDQDGRPTVDGAPVIFFHFSKLQRVVPGFWVTNHRNYGAPMNRRIRRLIYAPYIAEILAAEKLLRNEMPGRPGPIRYGERNTLRHPLWEKLHDVAAVLARGGWLCVVGRHAL